MEHVELHKLLESYVMAPVECDGFARLAHTALFNAGVDHCVMIGRLLSRDSKKQSPIHFWIELGSGQVIDFRARMWLGDDADVPHGIFGKSDYPKWEYAGELIDIPVLHPAVAALLSTAHPHRL
ncbi:hypothetical protein ACI77O_13645 [Pseudomonas tritici]|uniref:hypothetical protein n=1 Tax=Pseudomonas tritici TaxID=2745518 RepID=UPI00387B9D96